MMNELIVLDSIQLVPVIELEPWKFATRERSSPAGAGRDMPQEWDRYWLACLADSGIVGLKPIRPASWLVRTRELTSPATLSHILTTIMRDWGGPEALTDPDSQPVLNGGFALCCKGEVLAAPACCCDLGDLFEWRDAAQYRQSDWKIVWTGHPWLSVRFDEGRLIFSEPHESASPVARWTVNPEELGRAVAAAEAELEDFVLRLEPLLDGMGVPEVQRNARRLAGLER